MATFRWEHLLIVDCDYRLVYAYLWLAVRSRRYLTADELAIGVIVEGWRDLHFDLIFIELIALVVHVEVTRAHPHVLTVGVLSHISRVLLVICSRVLQVHFEIVPTYPWLRRHCFWLRRIAQNYCGGIDWPLPTTF